VLIPDVRWWLQEACSDLICKLGPLPSAWNEKGEQGVVPFKHTKTQEIPNAGCAWEVTTSSEQYMPKRTMVTSILFCDHLGAVTDHLSHQNIVECSVQVLWYSMKVLGQIMPLWETVMDIHFIYVPHLPYVPVLFVTIFLGHPRRLWVERLLDPVKKWFQCMNGYTYSQGFFPPLRNPGVNLLKPLVTWCTNKFNIHHLYVLPTLYVLCIYQRTNSELCHLYHKLVFITEI